MSKSVVVDMEEVKKSVDEYKRGERTLILEDCFEETQTFILFPYPNKVVDRHLRINKANCKISVEEAKTLKDDLRCKNKEAINVFLDLLERD